RSSEGAMFRVGGWGPHFGDDGSGFWIGREAVRSALRAVDSHADQTFARYVAQSLGLKSITEVVGAWAAGRIGVPEIAGLFTEIVALYPAEPVNRILGDAASHLRSLVEIAAGRVGVEDWRKSFSSSMGDPPVMRKLH